MASLLLASAGSHAAATLCNTGPGDPDPLVNGNGQSVSDVTYNGNNAANCYGMAAGNDSAASLNALAPLTGWGAGWALAARDNTDAGEADVSNIVEGLLWTVSASSASAGHWLLTAIDTNGILPANLGDSFDFVVGLKGGSGHAFYLFDDVTFDGGDGGTYAITFRNNGNRVPGLSHISVYARYSGPAGGRDDGQGGTVSAPGSLALAGVALIGLVAARRRRSA